MNSDNNIILVLIDSSTIPSKSKSGEEIKYGPSSVSAMSLVVNVDDFKHYKKKVTSKSKHKTIKGKIGKFEKIAEVYNVKSFIQKEWFDLEFYIKSEKFTFLFLDNFYNEFDGPNKVFLKGILSALDKILFCINDNLINCKEIILIMDLKLAHDLLSGQKLARETFFYVTQYEKRKKEFEKLGINIASVWYKRNKFPLYTMVHNFSKKLTSSMKTKFN